MAAFGAEDVFLEKLILISRVERNVSVLLSDILIIWLCAVSFSSAPHPTHPHPINTNTVPLLWLPPLLTEPLNYDLKEGEVELRLSATALLAALPNYPGS